LPDVRISLFVEALDDDIVFDSLPIILLLDSKEFDVARIDDCSSYELEVAVSTLELGSVNRRRVYDEVVSVTAGTVLN
jgi:hypothetical protein